MFQKRVGVLQEGLNLATASTAASWVRQPVAVISKDQRPIRGALWIHIASMVEVFAVLLEFRRAAFALGR